MARGQASAANAQLGKTNELGGAAEARSNTKENALMPGYTSLMNTGYLNPEEEHAAVTSEMGATAAPFDTANFEATRRAGATRNASDLTAQQDQLAMEEGRAAGDTAANLEAQKMHNQEAGMYGIEQLQQGDQREAESMYGLGPGTLQARAAGQSGDQAALGWAELGLGTKVGGKI